MKQKAQKKKEYTYLLFFNSAWKGLTKSQSPHTGAGTFRLERKHQISYNTKNKFEHTNMKYGHGHFLIEYEPEYSFLAHINICPHIQSLTYTVFLYFVLCLWNAYKLTCEKASSQ